MPKMTMRVILKSGVEFAIKCDKFTINRDGFGNVRGYDSGEKCECRAEEIETVHSQKCACGITEQDVESGWECPLDNPNETVKRCEDCTFAKETE